MNTPNTELPTTIEGVIEHLEQIIAHSIEKGSRMGYFAALYKRVTIAVKDKIAAGYFDDNKRMEDLDVIFANRYLKAYYAYKNGELCSVSWQVAFDASKQWKPLVIQQLLVGMNAHISLDLGIAAAEVQPNDIESLHDDFNKINEVLGDLINEVQDQLASIFPLLKPIDWIAGGADEKIAKFAMDIARDAAWEVAKNYSALSSNLARETYVHDRDLNVAGFGEKIINPGKLLNFLIRFLGWLEIGTVRWKIGKLNA